MLLTSGDAQELRAKVINILNKHEKIKDQNASDDKWRATETFKKNDFIVILPADKGRVTVVMKKDDCYEKCIPLFRDEKPFRN